MELCPARGVKTFKLKELEIWKLFYHFNYLWKQFNFCFDVFRIWFGVGGRCCLVKLAFFTLFCGMSFSNNFLCNKVLNFKKYFFTRHYGTDCVEWYSFFQLFSFLKCVVVFRILILHYFYCCLKKYCCYTAVSFC